MAIEKELLDQLLAGPAIAAWLSPNDLQLTRAVHIVERLHRTLLDEHFRIEGRRAWFETIEHI